MDLRQRMMQAHSQMIDSMVSSQLSSPVHREIMLSNIACDIEQAAKNTERLKSDISDMKQEIERLNRKIAILETKSKEDTKQAKKAAERAEIANQKFNALIAVFSAVLCTAFPLIISWLKAIFSS